MVLQEWLENWELRHNIDYPKEMVYTKDDKLKLLADLLKVSNQVEAGVINFLPELLKKCHTLIQQAIYTDDGIDGDDGQKLLDKIEQHIKVERSHRDVTGLE